MVISGVQSPHGNHAQKNATFLILFVNQDTYLWLGENSS
jgi:hypothetical protein